MSATRRAAEKETPPASHSAGHGAINRARRLWVFFLTRITSPLDAPSEFPAAIFNKLRVDKSTREPAVFGADHRPELFWGRTGGPQSPSIFTPSAG